MGQLKAFSEFDHVTDRMISALPDTVLRIELRTILVAGILYAHPDGQIFSVPAMTVFFPYIGVIVLGAKPPESWPLGVFL